MVLTSLLPGLRELRTPLTAGLLWLFAGWLIYPTLTLPIQAVVLRTRISTALESVDPVSKTGILFLVAYLVGVALQGLTRWLQVFGVFGLLLAPLSTPILSAIAAERLPMAPFVAGLGVVLLVILMVRAARLRPIPPSRYVAWCALRVWESLETPARSIGQLLGPVLAPGLYPMRVEITRTALKKLCMRVHEHPAEVRALLEKCSRSQLALTDKKIAWRAYQEQAVPDLPSAAEVDQLLEIMTESPDQCEAVLRRALDFRRISPGVRRELLHALSRLIDDRVQFHDRWDRTRNELSGAWGLPSHWSRWTPRSDTCTSTA